MLNLLDQSTRLQVIKQINGQENKSRKAESLKRFEVFSGRQQRYIVEKLESEFSTKTVQDMRKMLSINLCPRIINQLASIYNYEPDREFENVAEAQYEILESLYDDAKVDTKMALANKYFKLNNQCALQFVIKDGMPKLKVLLPHQYDVIPGEDPEKAFCYIVSVFDKFEYLSGTGTTKDLANPGRSPYKSQEYLDGMNQEIADSEDYKASLERYEVWTDELNFIMDGKGNILSEDTVNPIQKLPFVDITAEKDSEFFVRQGSSSVQFSIDFGAQLSDVSNIVRMQCYAQAIMSSEKMPTNATVGPNHIMWLQLDPNRPEMAPKFEFVSPNSDLKSALEFLTVTLRLYLTSEGVDPKTISGTGEAQSFTSGLERLLSNLDRFEASRQDIDIFQCAEYELSEIITDWLEVYQGTDLLLPKYQVGKLPDDLGFSINYAKPEAVQTKTETEDSVIKLLDKGLKTKKDALMELYNIDADSAEEMMAEIANDKQIVAPVLVQQQDNQQQDMQPQDMVTQ